MTGPELIAEALRGELAARVPAQAADVEARLGLPAGSIPAPALVAAQERPRLELDEWPALMVVVQRLTGLRRVDLDDGIAGYLASYPVRVFVMVRGDGHEDTDLARKRLTLVVREVILGRQQAAHVDETTYTESYSDVALDVDRQASIAGAYVEFVATVDELLDVVPELATAETITPILHPAAD